jgi:hypothetical protein
MGMKVFTEKQSKQAAARMEQYYLRLKRNHIRISLEDVEDTEWMWSDREIKRLVRLWNKAKPMTEIAKELRRSEIAVFFQCLDLIYKKEVKPRDWRVW